ncbi:hypothetical protein DFJ77DRAFT_475367 [Powellomyces hirtus]|nr:hypothetical protein DFJ77DRAFT_475367 [Powellomyces hirtus]
MPSPRPQRLPSSPLCGQATCSHIHSQKRTVCAATAFQPVLYRTTLRVAKHQRVFPLWRHKEVPQIVFPADADTAQQQHRAQKPKSDTIQQRLPGWDSLLRTIEEDPALPRNRAERDLERQQRKKERLRSRGYLDEHMVLASTTAINQQLRNRSAKEQTEYIQNLYLSTRQQFDRSRGGPVHHYALFPQAVTRIISSCFTSGRADLAQTVMDAYATDAKSMAAEGSDGESALTSNPFNTLMQAYARAGKQEQVQTVLKQMVTAGVAPTSRTYSILIKACGVDQIDTALQILDIMIKSNMRPSQLILNHVLDLCFQAGGAHRQQSAKVFNHLLTLYPVQPGSRTGPNSTTVSILLRQCQGDDDMESVFNDIKAWSLLRSPGVQEDLLRTAVRIKPPLQALSCALDWANRLAGLGVPLSPEATNVILEAYATNGDLVKGLELAERMRHQDMDASHREGILLRGVGRLQNSAENGTSSAPVVDQRGQDQVAWRIWNGLRERPEALTRKKFIEIVGAMGRAGDYRGLWYLHNLMMAKSWKPTPLETSSPSSSLSPSPSSSLTTPTDAESALFSRIDPTDPHLHRAFIRAFGARRGAADPTSAAHAFTHAPNDEHTALSLLGTIHSRREATPLLNALLALALARDTRLTPTTLATAFARVLERARNPRFPPMAFSPATQLHTIGVWDLNAKGPRPKEQVQMAQTAVVRAAAHGVAAAAKSIRQGSDIDLAVAALEKWILGAEAAEEKEGSANVDGALKELEAWTLDTAPAESNAAETQPGPTQF